MPAIRMNSLKSRAMHGDLSNVKRRSPLFHFNPNAYINGKSEFEASAIRSSNTICHAMNWVLVAMGGVAVLSVILQYVYSIAQPAEPAIIQFVDIAAKAVVRFVLLDGSTPERHQIEPMVGG